MCEVQHQFKKEADKLTVFIPCPGLSKSEVTMSFDKKEGILDIVGKSKNKELSEVMELDIEGKITIPAKYRSEKKQAKIINGILTIEFGLAADVNLVVVE